MKTIIFLSLAFVSMQSLQAYVYPNQFGTAEQQNLYYQQESVRLQREANNIQRYGY